MSASNFVGREEQSANYQVSSRKWLARGSDVFVKEFTLQPQEEVPWHTHTEVFDIFYCVEGKLLIERIDAATKQVLPDLHLPVGGSAKVDVGTAHHPYNPGPGVCRFIIIQGVGDYDYIPYAPN